MDGKCSCRGGSLSHLRGSRHSGLRALASTTQGRSSKLLTPQCFPTLCQAHLHHPATLRDPLFSHPAKLHDACLWRPETLFHPGCPGTLRDACHPAMHLDAPRPRDAPCSLPRDAPQSSRLPPCNACRSLPLDAHCLSWLTARRPPLLNSPQSHPSALVPHWPCCNHSLRGGGDREVVTAPHGNWSSSHSVSKKQQELAYTMAEVCKPWPHGVWILKAKTREFIARVIGTLQVGGKPVSFLVDTGAAYSVLTEPRGPVTSKKTLVQGATGQITCFPWTSKKDCRPRKDTNVRTPYVDVTSYRNYLDVPPYPLRGTEREFLRAVGYCHLWISGLAEIAKPLYSSTRGMHPLNWTEVEQQAFEKLKKALVSAPALALPDVTKPFHLYVSEVRGIAKGVLTQTLGPWKRPVAKRLDPVAAGWPACLRAVATTALLVKEAELALTTPHGVEALLRGAPERWMSNTRITQCQALLLDQPCVRFHKTLAINPASLLPDDNPEEPIQDCTEVTDAVRTARPDLTDVPLSSPDKVLFTVGSSYVQDGIRYAEQRGTTAQKVELLALIQALRWGHSAILRERGLPTTAGKDIKNKEEILALLEVIWLPRAVAIAHCKGHQKGETIAARGNRATDQTAKEAAQKPMGPLQVLVTLPYLDLRRPPLTPNKRRNWQNRSKPSKDQMATHLASPRLLNFCEAGEHWEVDFTEIKPPASGYKYLLALIDTFSGWVEAYPIRTEIASIVVKRLLQEIIPSFGLPVVIGSDNSPAFVAKVFQSHKQDSKSTLTKFVLETGENWTNLLPFAILWARCTPYQKGFPLRLLYTQRATHKLVRDALPVPTADPVHPFQPGDSVWVKKFTAQGLTPT
ncbi:hypothetical protein QTO34_017276 [Cnephaeus nilssonii]|uniref:Uncharacterized protein n=1 Tax=Cnephaeus nilssonii TaxID=3371016 RepID=A0AA40I1I1_CNENI|nr:hypothetical protein QTO34_017276 [Eptesicus nilssonii]